MSVNLEGRETCPDCGLPIANQTEWDTIPEGEGDWLCWEQGGCGEGEGVADRLRERVAELSAERDEAVANQDARRESLAQELRAVLRHWNALWVPEEKPESDLISAFMQLIGRLVTERDEAVEALAALTAGGTEGAPPDAAWEGAARYWKAMCDIARDFHSVAVAKADTAEDFIARSGYRRCDIPACNCGSWHGGHAEARLAEISEAIGDHNGQTILAAVQALASQRDELAAALDLARDQCDYMTREVIDAALRLARGEGGDDAE